MLHKNYAHQTDAEADGWSARLPKIIDYRGWMIIFDSSSRRDVFVSIREKSGVAVMVTPKQTPYQDGAIKHMKLPADQLAVLLRPMQKMTFRKIRYDGSLPKKQLVMVSNWPKYYRYPNASDHLPHRDLWRLADFDGVIDRCKKLIDAKTGGSAIKNVFSSDLLPFNDEVPF